MFRLPDLFAMLGALGVALTLIASASPTYETAAEEHYRRGVYCMDEVERDECAIEHFEDLIDLPDAPRGLVADAMMRLLKLYDDDDDTKDLLRRYWDVGMKRRSLAHLPYSARFFPPELDVWATIDVENILEAPVWSGLGFDVTEFVFTCDEQHRQDMYERHRWKRAERKGAATGQKPYEVIYEEMDASRQRKPPSPPGDRDYKAPLFAVVACPLAQALGHTDLREWKSMAGAMAHNDFTRSMGAAHIEGLEARVHDALKAGRLRKVGPRHWVLLGTSYEGQPVHVASLDLDEVITGTEAMVEVAIAARAKRKTTMNRDAERLVRGIPRDAGVYFVLTTEAMQGLGFQGMRDSTRKFLQALLPKPKGLQVAAAFGNRIGMFTRMPTDNPVKGRMLVALAQRFIDKQSAKDAELERRLHDLDLAEANDRKALLAAYVLSKARLRQIIWD